MHGDKIQIKIVDNTLFIQNKTNKKLDNVFIEVKNIFHCPIFYRVCSIFPNEMVEFQLGTYAFRECWDNEKLYVRVYHNHILIVDKHVNDKTKCFVLLSNKNFEKLTEQIIVGLSRYSNVDILHYTINYKSDLEYDYLTNIEFTLEGDTQDPQYMQFAKPPVFIDVIERGYKYAAFLDADMQVRPNINDVFSYIPEIEDGPILHKAVWDYTLAMGEYIPGPLLRDFMQLPPQKAPQGVTNVVIFSDKHYELFKEWKQICFSEEINSIRKKEFLHDELILNCLMWKRNVKVKLFCLTLNVIDEKDVEFFYKYDNTEYNDFVNMNDFQLGHPFQSVFPYDKSRVLAFHCVKDASVAKNINEIIYQIEIAKQNIMKKVENNIYDSITKNTEIKKKVKPIININYINGAYVEIKNSKSKQHKVFFIDKKTGKIEHQGIIGNNCWIKASKEYFVDWKIRIEYEDGVYENNLNFNNETVYIALDSNSIGDTLAWFPYVEEFRKKHNCNIICSTFHNSIFEENYPHIKFIKPGEVAYDIKGMYTIGWFYNTDGSINYLKNPTDFRNQNLQKTSSDILGLDFKELKPVISKKSLKKKKQICIAIHSTSQAKYWNNTTGWQEVVDWCKSKGYEVRLLSRENDGYMGNSHPTGIIKHPSGPLENVINELVESELFIGIGSGLSWLAWASGTPTMIISGFSNGFTEPSDCYKVNSPTGKCTGCFNKYKLDPSDWNWCPEHKGTYRQFECTKTITGKDVIEKLEKVIV